MPDPSDTMSRAERKKHERRQALLAAAIELVRERGIYGTRIEDITERADMAKGAFYNYFGSKDALVLELLGNAVRELKDDYLARLNGSSGPARVEHVAELHHKFLAEHPMYALLLHQTRGQLQLPATTSSTADLRKLFQEYLDVLAVALTQSQEPSAREREVAAVIAGAVAGAHTFLTAAGLQPSSVAARILAHGVSPALERKKITK